VKFKTKAKVAGGVFMVAMAGKGGAFGPAGHAATHAGGQATNAITTATRPAPSGPLNSSVLTADQNAFANELAARTGLNVYVVGGELLAEESGSNAAGREREYSQVWKVTGNQDWGNVGYTDSGFIATQAYAWWHGPAVAADYTAAWMKGTWGDPPFGYAASSIRDILTAAGHSVPYQIGAYMASGWASGGYGGLATDVQEVENGQR
jgi:hypothetical protein